MQFTFGQPVLEDLLRQFVYVVPRFQRSYEWTEIEWDDLWADIISALGQSKPHFMGAVVVSRSFNDETVPQIPGTSVIRFVIDGQQRLVTLTILLARIHKKLAEAGLAGAEIQAELMRWILIYDPLEPQQSSVPRLFLNDEAGRDVLTSIVNPLSVPANKPKKAGRPPKSLQLMRKASEFFDARISSFASGSPDGEMNALRQLAVAAGRKLQFVEIEVDSEADAYTIFESLNARGMDLTVADLVKNLLLGRANRLADQLDKMGIVGETDKAVEVAWGETGDLIRTGFSERLPAFLRHYWIATHEFVREDRLYKEFSDLVRSETSTMNGQGAPQAAKRLVTLTQDIATSAAQYVWLWAGEGNAPYDPHPSLEVLRSRLNGVRVFNAVQVLPVLLAAVRRHVELPRLKRLVEAAETAIVRRSFAEQPGNKIERESGEMCRAIRDGKDEGIAVDSVVQALKKLAADGQEQDPFLVRSLVAERAKYVLLAMENRMRERLNKEQTLLDPSKFDVEHVLPQSAKEDNWPIAVWGDAEEDQKAWLNRLGNFALLSRDANRAIGNAKFYCGSEPGTVKCCKRHTYRNSELLLTREIADSETWGPVEIQRRQARLATIAAEVWSYA